MKITFDPAKRSSNLAKHGGLDFADLDETFFASSIVIPARAGRSMAIGRFRDDVIAVVFSALGSEAISVISMRPAGRKERRHL